VQGRRDPPDDLAVQQQSDALASWWRQLPPDVQTDLLSLSPAAQLPEDLTRELRAFGVQVADVGLVLRLGERVFTAHAQPPALQEFLAAARIWAAIWAGAPR
jgi:hypothetical protein